MTPETFCPGQKSVPCNEMHREQVSTPQQSLCHKRPYWSCSSVPHSPPYLVLQCSVRNEQEWDRVGHLDESYSAVHFGGSPPSFLVFFCGRKLFIKSGLLGCRR